MRKNLPVQNPDSSKVGNSFQGLRTENKYRATVT